MKEIDKNGCNILIMTFTNLEKTYIPKRAQNNDVKPPPLSPAKSKRQKSHLATAVICN